MKNVKCSRYSHKKIYFLFRAGCFAGMAILLGLLCSCSSITVGAIDIANSNLALEETVSSSGEPVAVPIPIESKPQISVIGQVVCRTEPEAKVYLNATDASRIISKLNAGETADLISYDKRWACISVGEPPFISGFVNLKDLSIKDPGICE